MEALNFFTDELDIKHLVNSIEFPVKDYTKAIDCKSPNREAKDYIPMQMYECLKRAFLASMIVEYLKSDESSYEVLSKVIVNQHSFEHEIYRILFDKFDGGIFQPTCKYSFVSRECRNASLPLFLRSVSDYDSFFFKLKRNRNFINLCEIVEVKLLHG